MEAEGVAGNRARPGAIKSARLVEGYSCGSGWTELEKERTQQQVTPRQRGHG